MPIQTYDDLDNPLLPGMEPRSYVKIGRSEYICWDKASTVCSLGWRQHSLLAGLASAFVQQKTKFVSNANMHAVLCWSCHVCVAVQAAFASVVLHLWCRATSHVSISSPLLVVHVLHKVAWFPQA